MAILTNETDEQLKFTQLFQSDLLHAARFFPIIALILAPTLLIYWKLFIQPLARIYYISNAVKQGDQQAHVPDSPVLEVQQVNMAFNEMIDHLSQGHVALERMNRKLEETVSERTRAMVGKYLRSCWQRATWPERGE